MSLKGFTKTSASTGVPVWISGRSLETAQGGFALVLTGLVLGTTLKAGTPVSFDESTRLATVISMAEVYETAGGSATDYKVKKGHNLVVGQYLASAVGGKAYAITVIDTSNADYDLVTVGTSIGAAAAGVGLFVSSATGATAAALPVTPKGLLYDDVLVETGASVSVVLRGTVYERRIPVMAATVKSAVPVHIIFSQSY